MQGTTAHLRSPRVHAGRLTVPDTQCTICRRPPAERAFADHKLQVSGIKAVKCPGCGCRLATPEQVPGFLSRADEILNGRAQTPRTFRTPLHRVGYGGSGGMFHSSGRVRARARF